MSDKDIFHCLRNRCRYIGYNHQTISSGRIIDHIPVFTTAQNILV